MTAGFAGQAGAPGPSGRPRQAGAPGRPGRPGQAGHQVTLLSRPGCHLCDTAREVIARVTADLGVPWEERDITQSEADLRDYWDKIPVTLIDGVQHDFWQVSEQRLRSALTR